MKKIYLFLLMLSFGCGPDNDDTISFVISNKTIDHIKITVYYKSSYYGNESNIYILEANADTLVYWDGIYEGGNPEDFYFDNMPFDSILIYKNDSLRALGNFVSRKEWEYNNKKEYRLSVFEDDFIE